MQRPVSCLSTTPQAGSQATGRGRLTIRPATPLDAPWAVPLVQSVFPETGWQLTGTDDDAQAVAATLPFFTGVGSRLSFERTLVALQADQALGIVVSYPGDRAAALDEPFRVRLRALGLPDTLEVEAEPNEWYVDTLLTTPQARGCGVGDALLRAVAAQAKSAGWPTLGLLVEPENTRAQRLYTRLGFMLTGERHLCGQVMLHLSLDLSLQGANPSA